MSILFRGHEQVFVILFLILLVHITYTNGDVLSSATALSSPMIPNDVQEPSFFPQPLTPKNDNQVKTCLERVQNNECNSNPTMMVKICRNECMNDDTFSTIGYFIDQKEIEELDYKRNSSCFDVHTKGNNDNDDDDDDDDDDFNSCQDYVDDDQCMVDPGFMFIQCAKSCLVCREPGVKTFPIGKKQEIHPNDIDNNDAIEATLDVIINTYTYMNDIMTQPQYASIRTTCQNNDEYCAALAASGSCNKPADYDTLPDDDEDVLYYDFMMSECAPACQSCSSFISEEEAATVEDCVPDMTTNILGAGDLNRMFERLVGESEEGDVVVSKDKVKVLSRPSHPEGFIGDMNDPVDYILGPWVVTLDNFLSDEECDRLIQLGSKRGYERSTLEEEKDYDEEQLAKEREGDDAYRTSTNTWCMDKCYEDKVTQRVIGRMVNATGIPDSYAEHLQLLSYVPGQYYKEHHDYSEDTAFKIDGPRILTFFLYLNDVEEGGATRLTDLTGDDGGIFMDIQPKKGMALIWPSVLDEDPLVMDVRTFHEALPVLKGRKFGANAWFHLRQVKDTLCDYDLLNAIGDIDDEDQRGSLSDEL